MMSLLENRSRHLPDYSDAEIAERNTRALAEAAEIRARRDDAIAAPTWDYNLFFMYGQSLAVGQGSFPPLSTRGRDDIFMLGDSVAAATTASDAPVVGPPVLKPMVATVVSDGRVLDPDEVARLPANMPLNGETPLEGALAFARHLMEQGEPAAAPALGAFVGASLGIGGNTIEQLSKGANPDRFNRLPSRARQIATIVKARGKSFGVAGFFLLQGEANYSPPPGSQTATDKQTYKQRVKAVFDAFSADVAGGVAGQDKPPVVITYQTGGIWAREGLAIGQAQFEMSLENPGWYLAAPAYAVPRRGPADGHLSANSSRWLGMQLGKVWHEVAVMGRGWRPTSPLRATFRDRTVLVDFHVPVPPLRFEPVWAGANAVTYDSKGFSVRDARGEVPLAAVTIVADALVALDAARPLVAPVHVSYGHPSTGGNGNLRDSDARVASASYEYDAARGDPPAADLAPLVGKPYPLWNWCVAFAIEAVEDQTMSSADLAVRRLLETHSRKLNTFDAPVHELEPRPRLLARVGWKTRVLAIILVLVVADAALTRNGALVREEMSPQYGEDGVITWRKRCDYRVSLLFRSRFIGPEVDGADRTGDSTCPPHLR